MKAYNPVTIILFRLIISSVLVFTAGKLLKRQQIPAKKDLKLFLLLAFFEPFLYFLGESYGLTYVSSTVAAVIIATIPLLSPIAAWYFFREKVSWKNIIGFLFSFFGVTLVVLDGSFRFDAPLIGIALVFLAVLSAIGYSIVLRYVVFKYNSVTIITWQNLIGIGLFLPVWLAADLKEFLVTPFHPQAFRAILLLAFFASTLAFLFFTQSIRKIGVNRSNTFVNLIPAFVAVLSFFILNEELGLQKIIGIMVVITGLFLAQVKSKKGSRKKENG